MGGNNLPLTTVTVYLIINLFISHHIFYLSHIYLPGLNSNLTVTDAKKGMKSKTSCYLGSESQQIVAQWSEQLYAQANKFDA
jgi:hypothetical protein